MLPRPLAAKRVALVIGNAAYKHTAELTNPKNDAADMVAALKSLGFEVVEGIDLDKTRMERTIRRFARQLKGAELGAFFYAGHGLQVDGKNYLVPTDAELTTADALDFEMIRLDVVQRVMEAATKTNVIFLDACRDNPLSRNLARALGTRSAGIGRGLAQTEAGLGTLISYATQPGNVALDGNARNSPYTSALKQHLGTPGEDLSAVLIRVRNDVIGATSGKQVPWDQSALRARLYLGGRVALPAASGDAAVLLERQRRQILASTSIAELDAYTRLVPELAPVITQRRQQLALLADREAEEARKRDPAFSVKPGSGRSFRDCPDCPEMVVVPAGSFIMGSNDGDSDEQPVHKVTISKPIAVGKFEVRVDQYEAFVRTTGHEVDNKCTQWTKTKLKVEAPGSFRNPGFSQSGEHPAVCLNWLDAKAYVSWLSQATGKPYRLLTEAEWEYSVRAATTTSYHWGDDLGEGNANCRGCGSQWDNKRTAPVGSFKPNAWGLHDMHGNAWEWVEDHWHNHYVGGPLDGTPWVGTGDTSRRVVRGGAWSNKPRKLRSALRLGFSHLFRLDSIGFRVGRAIEH